MSRRHVISRGLCRYRYFPYGDIRRGDRRGYLRVQLLTWQPFLETGYGVVDGAHGAMVFAWDAAALNQRCETAALPPARRVIPETLLRPRGGEGVLLNPCSDGFEAQVWQGGDLLASRWWAAPPGAEEWANFQRGAALPPAQHSPVPNAATAESTPATWLARPWALPHTMGELQERERLAGHALAGALGLLLLAPTVWLAQGLQHESAAITSMHAERDRLEAQSRPLLQARAEALQALHLAEVMHGTVSRPDALQLLAHIAQRLPADGSQLRELEWEGQRVRLVVGAPPTTPRITYVNALEGGGWLLGIREEKAEASTPGVGLVATLAGMEPPNSASSAPPTAPASGATR